jgi:YihY family inner membrane protein
MNKILSTYSRFWLRVEHGVARIDRRTGGWLILFGGSFKEILSFESSLVAAATAYFTLFSVFPLILLTLAMATRWLDPLPIGSEIMERIEFVLPAFEDLLGANLEQIARARNTVTRLSALTLIWSASSAIYVLTRALDNMWETDTTRPAWRHRALAIIITLGISVVLWIGTFAWSIAAPLASSLLPDRLVNLSPYLSDVGTAILSIVVFGSLYYMLPHAKMRWPDVLLGAVVAGLLWEVAKRVFILLVTNYLTLSNLVYGSVTTIIAFLAWAYASSLIFLLGGYVNVRYRRRRQAQQAAAQQMS